MIASAGDEIFLQYIKELENEHILDDTMVVFFSDHGQHMSPGNFKQQGEIDKLNFFTHILFPNKYLTPEIEANLMENSQRLLSHMDLHKTIVQVMRGKLMLTSIILIMPMICCMRL